MSKYYVEQNQMFKRFRSYWLPKILSGQAVSTDEIFLDAMEKYRCSTRALRDYIDAIIRVDDRIKEDGSYIVLSGEKNVV